jgi:uncharacterized protein YjiS (DUF1127 family)
MNILKSYQNWRRYRDTAFELRQLSDRALGDMGIERSNINKIARRAVHG